METTAWQPIETAPKDGNIEDSARRRCSLAVRPHVAPSAPSHGSGHLRLQSEDQRRWHACFRKIKFPTIEAAYTAKKRLQRNGTLSLYQCQYCGLWHLTKQLEKVANG